MPVKVKWYLDTVNESAGINVKKQVSRLD